MLGSGRAALEGEAATLADMRPIDVTDLRCIGPDIRIIGTPGAAQREQIGEHMDASFETAEDVS
jgi:diaminohydroxyphosphoribosylaminopyrimidine deaminase/5-amino-6-(5-phosphoribosylamino)uracil reductase